MSTANTVARGARPAIGFFERYLTVWVALCIAGGILVGQLLPQLFQAISLFGFHSGAALATVVGVLIEVPVMLLVVSVVNRSQHWYEAKTQR